MIIDGWGIGVGNKCHAPDGEEVIDGSMGEMSLAVEEFCDFKSSP